MIKNRVFIISNLSLLTFLLALSVAVVSCSEKSDNTDPLAAKRSLAPYAEISIKEGGEWHESSEGRNEYIDGSFTNVENMTVPDEHTDHTGFIRYEGPGWENQNVGYRLYLDWRNAIDVFGKKVDSLALPHVGQENFDNYHEMAGWGMDILGVGNSLGIGGYGRYVDGEVHHFNDVENTSVTVENTDEQARVNISYTDWKTAGETVDLQSELSIFPAGRHTKASFSFSEPVEGFSTGIVDHGLPLNQAGGEKWGYISTYGAQTLVDDTDKLGMAIFYRIDDVKEIVQGEDDHLVVFEPANNLTYYFLAAWEQELNGITTNSDFESNLNRLLTQLDENGVIN